ncbi:PIN domain-containing protein [Saccharicrinis sp. FJH2]|uniref:PIN domain-containing protein n=1 Tax=Saccharicrinis sp. FJH65 TaxID=3344659 RepID=UPI0035F3BA0F
MSFNESEIVNLKEEISKELNKKFPKFEDSWNNTVKELGNEFVGLIKELLQDEFQLLKEITEFRFSIVIDNNFIFGQIKNIIEKNLDLEDSFIYKLTHTSYVDVYAPYKLKEELYDKIEYVLKANKSKARQFANFLLEKIIIKDAEWIDEWKKAKNLIGHIDKDDVPYLALAFHTQSHAIISMDKIFKTQSLSKSWNVQETDKIITSYNSGFISFCFIGTGLKIMELIWKTLLIVFKTIAEIFIEIILGIGVILSGAYELILKKIPPWVYLGILFLAIGAAFISEDFRNLGKDFFSRANKVLKDFSIKIKEFLDKLLETIKEFWEVFKPIGVTSLEIIGYLTLEYQTMVKQVEKLNIEKAS